MTTTKTRTRPFTRDAQTTREMAIPDELLDRVFPEYRVALSAAAPPASWIDLVIDALLIWRARREGTITRELRALDNEKID